MIQMSLELSRRNHDLRKLAASLKRERRRQVREMLKRLAALQDGKRSGGGGAILLTTDCDDDCEENAFEFDLLW